MWAAWLTAPWFVIETVAGLRLVDVLLVAAAGSAFLLRARFPASTRLWVPSDARKVALGVGLVVVGVIAGSLVTAGSIEPFATIVGYGIWALLPLALLVRSRATDDHIAALALAFLGGVVLSVVASAIVGTTQRLGRWQGLTGHPNQLAMTIAMAVPLLAVIPPSRRGWVARIGLGAILLVGLERTGSRSALIATLAVLAIMAIGVVRRTPGGILRPRILLVVVAVVGLAVFTVPRSSPDVDDNSTYGRILGSGSAAGSDEARGELLEGGVEALFSARGVFGGGYYLARGPHNAFLEAWVAGGIPALIGLVLVFGPIGWFAIGSAARRAPPGLAGACALSVSAFAIAISLNNALWARYGWVMIALFAMARTNQRMADAPSRERSSPAPRGARVHAAGTDRTLGFSVPAEADVSPPRA